MVGLKRCWQKALAMGASSNLQLLAECCVSVSMFSVCCLIPLVGMSAVLKVSYAIDMLQ